MMQVTEEEKQYWRELRMYGYSYDAIIRKSFGKFGVKRNKSVVHKYASDVDEMLEDGSVQLSLPRFSMSKMTRMRMAGIVERFDVHLDDILELGLDAFELMKDNDMDPQELLRIRSFLEKLEKKRKGAKVVLWTIYMLDQLEEAGMDLNDISRLRRFLEGVLAADLDRGTIGNLPEIFEELSNLNMEISYLLWILKAISKMTEWCLPEDVALLLLKELDLEKRSGKSLENAFHNLMNRVDTKLNLEEATLKAKEKLESVEAKVEIAGEARVTLETWIRSRLQEIEESMKAKIAAHEEQKRVIEGQTQDAHRKLQETTEELHTAQRALETVKRKVEESEGEVEKKTQELNEITREFDEKREWLEKNGIPVEMAKGFLGFLGAQPEVKRISLMVFLQAALEACRDPRSCPKRRDTFDFFSMAFRRMIFDMVADSTGHMREFHTQKGELIKAQQEPKRLRERIVDLERENLTLKTQLRVA